MQRTDCDICGQRIGNTHYHVRADLRHLTSHRGETVGTEDFWPLDICGDCIAKPVVLAEVLVTRHREELVGEDMAVMEAPRPLPRIAVHP